MLAAQVYPVPFQTSHETLFVCITHGWVQLVLILVTLDNGPESVWADIEKMRFVRRHIFTLVVSATFEKFYKLLLGIHLIRIDSPHELGDQGLIRYLSPSWEHTDQPAHFFLSEQAINDGFVVIKDPLLDEYFADCDRGGVVDCHHCHCCDSRVDVNSIDLWYSNLIQT